MKKYTQEQINKILEACGKARRAGIEVKLDLRKADLDVDYKDYSFNQFLDSEMVGYKIIEGYE